MIRKAIKLVILTSMLVGCSSDSDSKDSKASVESADYLIRCENRMLTPKGADKLLEAQLSVVRGARARAQHYINSIDSKFKFDTVLRKYAEQKKILIDEATVKRHQLNFLKKNPNLNKDMIGTLQRLIRDEVRAKTVRKAFEESCIVKIPQAEVTRRAKLIAQINEKSSLSNACQYARATNCWAKIRSGEISFADACKNFDETKNPSPDGAWAELALDAFEPEESQLREALPKMQVGDITPPLPGDNGLVIVKLLGTGSNTENKGLGVPTKTYRLARIFFHLYEIFPVQTEEELRQDLTQIELTKRWSDFVEHLLSKEEFRYGRDGQTLSDWKANKLKEIKK